MSLSICTCEDKTVTKKIQAERHFKVRIRGGEDGPTLFPVEHTLEAAERAAEGLWRRVEGMGNPKDREVVEVVDTRTGETGAQFEF